MSRVVTASRVGAARVNAVDRCRLQTRGGSLVAPPDAGGGGPERSGPPPVEVWSCCASVGRAAEVGEALLRGLEGVERGVAEARVVLDDEVPSAAAGRREDGREVDVASADDL